MFINNLYYVYLINFHEIKVNVDVANEMVTNHTGLQYLSKCFIMHGLLSPFVFILQQNKYFILLQLYVIFFKRS